MRKALAESMSQPKAPSKPKGPDPDVVESIRLELEAFFTTDQVIGYMNQYNQDIDETIKQMKIVKKLKEKKGKKNHKVEDEAKRKEAQAKKDEENKIKQQQKDLDNKYRVKDKDYELFAQVDPEILNQIYDEVDYGV